VSLFSQTLKPIGADRAQIDALVDILDRAEPDRTGWRNAFDRLKDELTRARRLRPLIWMPAVVVYVVLSVLYFFTTPRPVLGGYVALMVILVFFWGFAMRRAFPVLELEGRIATLLRYYGAKDVSPEEGGHS
jgi:hypothetical protein